MNSVHGMLLALLLAGTAHAEWAKKDYSAEYNACLSPCDANHPKDHEKCINYCTCVTDGMQRQFADHERMIREITQQKLRDRISSLQKITNVCNLRQWGSGSRRLKF